MSKKKKIIIISAIVFTVVLAGAVTSFLLVQDHNRKQYEQYVSTSLINISEWGSLFNTSEDHAQRVFLYRGLSDAHVEYSDRETNNDEIRQKYINTLSMMEAFLVNWYNDEISKIESIEATGQAAEIITAYSNKINDLNSVKTLIDSDNVFDGDNRHGQLHGKADGLINFYTDAADWFSRIDNVNDRFILADRDSKLGVFVEFTEMHSEYGESNFTHRSIDELLESSRANIVYWFYHWYDNLIDELSVYNIVWCSDCDNCADNDDCDDCGDCMKTLFLGFDTGGENGYGEEKPWDYLITAMIELNDLVIIFSVEGDVLFTQFGVTHLNGKLNSALLENRKSLEALGIEIINSMDFHIGAAGIAIEKHNELFEEWKTGYRDNNHLPTYPEILQEAIALGQEEHNRIVEAEIRATRSGGGGLFRITCNACGASRMMAAGRYIHWCDTDEWEREGGGGSSGGGGGGSDGGGNGGAVRRSVGDSWVETVLRCDKCNSPIRKTVIRVESWGYEVSPSCTGGCS